MKNRIEMIWTINIQNSIFPNELTVNAFTRKISNSQYRLGSSRSQKVTRRLQVTISTENVMLRRRIRSSPRQSPATRRCSAQRRRRMTLRPKARLQARPDPPSGNRSSGPQGGATAPLPEIAHSSIVIERDHGQIASSE
jgi:hypothetical protein